MKCISCDTEINPKWKHAIDINVCPFCGQHIMEEHLKNCVAALAAAMDEMQKYPEQLDDWLLSNHSYIKTDSPDLVNYLPEEILHALRKPAAKAAPVDDGPKVIKMKVPDGQGGITIQEVIVEKTQSEQETSGFFERAEVLGGAGKTSGKSLKAPGEPAPPKSVAEKTRNLKARVAEIKKAGSEALTTETGLASVMDPAMLANADPDAVAEFQAILDGNDIVASGLPPTSSGDMDDDSAMTDRVLANNMRMAQKSNGVNSAQERDMQTLKEMQNRVANTQKRMGSGGFSRST